MQIRFIVMCLLLSGLTATLGACGRGRQMEQPTSGPAQTAVQGTHVSASTPASAAGQPTAVPSTAPVQPSPTPTPPSHAAMAMALLVSELKVPASEVRLVTYEKDVWHDASLGCPAPGQSYMKSTVAGWKFLIEHGRDRYEFHADDSGLRLVNCTAMLTLYENSINPGSLAGLSDVTSIAIYRRDISTSQFRLLINIDDREELARFAASLDSKVIRREATQCAAIFRLEFKLPAREEAFEFVCPGNFDLLRGAQDFWEGQEGVAPKEFSELVGKYVSQLPLPGLPDQ